MTIACSPSVDQLFGKAALVPGGIASSKSVTSVAEASSPNKVVADI